MGIGWKNFDVHDKKNLDFLEQPIGGNLDVKDSVSEDQEGNDEHVENWKKGNAYYIVAENVARLCPTVLQKIKL